MAHQNAFVLGVTQFLHHGLLLGDHGRTIDPGHGAGDPLETVMPLQPGHVGTADQDLRWHAADVHAGATDHLAALDHRHPGAGLRGLDGRGKGPRAAADDGDVQAAIAVAGSGRIPGSGVIGHRVRAIPLGLDCGDELRDVHVLRRLDPRQTVGKGNVGFHTR